MLEQNRHSATQPAISRPTRQSDNTAAYQRIASPYDDAAPAHDA
jgi:hypothetical protein